MTERARMLKNVQTACFALNDVELYLDTHPSCAQALAYYRTLQTRYSEAAAAYQNKFGPLTIHAQSNDQRWDWIESPWPWESEAN